jgi:hypothetical protein
MAYYVRRIDCQYEQEPYDYYIGSGRIDRGYRQSPLITYNIELIADSNQEPIIEALRRGLELGRGIDAIQTTPRQPPRPTELPKERHWEIACALVDAFKVLNNVKNPSRWSLIEL